MQGSGVLAHSAKAFWVILMNCAALSWFAFSHAPLATIQLPYRVRPASFQATKPMSAPGSRGNTWCKLKNEVVASTVFALSAPSLALASMFTHVTEFGSMPFVFARAGHMVRSPSPAGLPIFLPARSLSLLMPLLLSQYSPCGELA